MFFTKIHVFQQLKGRFNKNKTMNAEICSMSLTKKSLIFTKVSTCRELV